MACGPDSPHRRGSSRRRRATSSCPALLLLVLERPGYGYELVPRLPVPRASTTSTGPPSTGPCPSWSSDGSGRPVVPEPDGGPGPTGLPDHPRRASGSCATGWGWSRRSTTIWARCSAATWPPGPPTPCWPRWRGAGPPPSAPGGRRCRPPRLTRRRLEAVPQDLGRRGDPTVTVRAAGRPTVGGDCNRARCRAAARSGSSPTAPPC